MIKEEFIDKVLSRFAYYTEKDTQGALKDTYDRILTKKIDYTALWDKFCNEYASKTPPTGVELKNMARTCLIQQFEIEPKQWLQVRIYNPILKAEINSDCFPIGTTQDKILKTYEKKFNCSGWKILEII